MDQEFRARLGQREALRCPLEELLVDRALQVSDAAEHSGVGHVEPSRRFDQRLLADKLKEILHVIPCKYCIRIVRVIDFAATHNGLRHTRLPGDASRQCAWLLPMRPQCTRTLAVQTSN